MKRIEPQQNPSLTEDKPGGGIYLIDMIHHNPGEPPMDSAFRDPAHLKDYGFQGQAFKHINTVLTLEREAPGLFPGSEAERAWLQTTRSRIGDEIREAKARGLSVYYHIDLFVLPRRIVEAYADRLTDPVTGRISPERSFTLQLHRALFDELFERFPAVDGLIVRVGETYLHDTPYHLGNGAVHYSPDVPEAEKAEQFVRLLNFLREEVCVKHGRELIHRTWDTWPNRFHASPAFYLRVTDQVPPHPRLLFSIKHTVVDFHRWVDFNPCLTLGNHRQIVEVQCQREYEGKGAYPNYVIRGVIEGFPEQGPRRKGLREIVDHPLFAGVYTWSRGGGWYGPEVTRENELWCDLNAYVIAGWVRDPSRGEAAVFMDYAEKVLGMRRADAEIFRRIALLSEEAVLKGKCCAVYDRRPKDLPGYPTNQWMRDDVLHGLDRLEQPFAYLRSVDGVAEALAEKAESVACWQRLRACCETFSADVDPDVRAVITATAEYGLRFFTAVASAWRALLPGWCLRQGDPVDPAAVSAALADFERDWAVYQALPEDCPRCAGRYRLHGWAWPGKPPPPGLRGSLDELREMTATSTLSGCR